MALRRSLLRIDKASLFETFGSLKIRNFGYTPSCLQLLRKSMSSLSLFCLYFNFSYFRRSLTVTFPCFRAISLYIFIIFLGSTKPKIDCKKSKWLNEHNLNKPKLYVRYVDDILAAFEKEQDSLNFLNFLNNKHPNIKFTTEKQVNHSIAFFDVFISGINNQNLTLQTYHKSIYIELLLNFKSFASFSYKINLIKCFIDRSFKFVTIETLFIII